MQVTFILFRLDGHQIGDLGGAVRLPFAHQFRQRHRRDAALFDCPPCREQRTQDVKPFFQFDGLRQIHGFQSVACDAAIMVQQRGGLDVLRRKRVQTTCEIIVLRINHRRTQPFEQRGIAFPQQAQRFADVPAANVKPLVFDKFKRVFCFVDLQIIWLRTDINGAHVVIAVGRGKAPCAAAALYRQQEMQRLGMGDVGEFFLNGLFHDVSFNRGRLKTLKTGFQTTFAF